MLAACSLLLLLGAWFVWLFIVRSSNPERHPFLARLARYGPIETSAREIDSEARADCRHFGGVDVTASWLIANTRTGASAMRLDSVVWAYLGPLDRYGVITAFDRFGQVWEQMDVPRSQRVTIMQAIVARSPACMLGLNGDLKQLWKRSTDKSKFLESARSQFPGVSATRISYSAPPVIDPVANRRAGWILFLIFGVPVSLALLFIAARLMFPNHFTCSRPFIDC